MEKNYKEAIRYLSEQFHVKDLQVKGSFDKNKQFQNLDRENTHYLVQEVDVKGLGGILAQGHLNGDGKVAPIKMYHVTALDNKSDSAIKMYNVQDKNGKLKVKTVKELWTPKYEDDGNYHFYGDEICNQEFDEEYYGNNKAKDLTQLLCY